LRSAPSRTTISTRPVVATADSGRFLVTWLEQDTSVTARLFSPIGQPLTGELAIGGGAFWDGPEAAVLADGRFLVVWADGELKARIIDANGQLVGGTLTLGDAGSGTEYRCDVATLSEERFIVAWNRELGGQISVHARTVDPDDPLAASELEVFSAQQNGVNDTIYAPEVSVSETGAFVVTWIHSPIPVRNRHYIPYARLYDDDQQPVTAAILLGGPDDITNRPMLVAMTASGGFYVLTHATSALPPVTLSHYDAAGALTDGPDAVCSADCGTLLDLRPDGSFYLAGRTDYPSTFAQAYDAAGVAQGEPLPLSDDLTLRLEDLNLEFSQQGSVIASYVGFGDGTEEALVRRFCDSSDSSCSICPGFDDSIDTDADAVPDGCDPCTNVDGQQTASAARTVASTIFLGQSIPKRDDRLEILMGFELPDGAGGIADLPVAASGMRVRVESFNDAAVADLELPGGTFAGAGTRGWQTRPTRLRYLDRTTAPVNGVRKVVLTELPSLTSRSRVRLKLTGYAGRYAEHSDLMPLQTIVSFGGTAGAECAEAEYVEEQCSAELAMRCAY